MKNRSILGNQNGDREPDGLGSRRLEDELYKSLEYRPSTVFGEGDLRAAAHELTVHFLSRLPRIRDLLQTDAEAAYNGDPAALSKEEVIVAYPSSRRSPCSAWPTSCTLRGWR